MKQGYKYWIGVLAAIFLGVTFVVAGAGKLFAGSKGFEAFVIPSFLPQALFELIYSWVPYIEITIGGLLLLGIAIKFATCLSGVLIAGFIASNIFTIYIGAGAVPCHGCFGVLGGLTATAALIMDGIMAVMVVAILVCYQGGFFNRTPWFLEGEQEEREVSRGREFTVNI